LIRWRTALPVIAFALHTPFAFADAPASAPVVPTIAPDIAPDAAFAPPPPTHYFATVALGAGFGYIGGLKTEAVQVRPDSNWAPTLVHVQPELGIRLTDWIALSLRGRVQIGTGAHAPGAHSSAWAGFLAAELGPSPDHGFAAELIAEGGVGRIRQSVSLEDTTLPGAVSDTTSGGLGIGGLGVALTWSARHTFALRLEAMALVTWPSVSENLDLSAGFTKKF
jgi:hypothetical protein